MSDHLERVGAAYAAACDASPEDWKREARAAADLIVALNAELDDAKARVERLMGLAVYWATKYEVRGKRIPDPEDLRTVLRYADAMMHRALPVVEPFDRDAKAINRVRATLEEA